MKIFFNLVLILPKKVGIPFLKGSAFTPQVFLEFFHQILDFWIK